jgi:hypothetical protein
MSEKEKGKLFLKEILAKADKMVMFEILEDIDYWREKEEK